MDSLQGVRFVVFAAGFRRQVACRAAIVEPFVSKAFDFADTFSSYGYTRQHSEPFDGLPVN